MNRLLLFFISVSILLHGWLWLYLQQQPQVKPRAVAALSSPLKLQHVTFKQRVTPPAEAKPVEVQEQPKPEPKPEPKKVTQVQPEPTPKPITKKTPPKKPTKKIAKKKPAKPKPKLAKVVKPNTVKKPPVKKVVKPAKPKPKVPPKVAVKTSKKPIKQPQKQTQVASTTPVVAPKSLGASHREARVKPNCKTKEPVYPSRARRRNQEGQVLVKVELSANGEKKDISIEKSSGYPLLDREALKVVRRSTCTPMILAGKAVASTYFRPVVFKFN